MTGAAPADLEVPVRGEGLLRAAERPFVALERLSSRFLPERFNPLLQTGALANVSLIVAIVSGILLLLWYVPSVHQSYPSVQAMDAHPWTSGLVRSIHRYASDATVLFAGWHGLRLLVARRFTGPRWLAWVTGLALVAGLWLLGWLGYWLLWDEAARQVALGTARLADALPIFAEPMSRSFLMDATVNSLLFFVVFFIHMLLPLALAVLLWLHIGRVSRSKFLPVASVAAVVVAATAALSRLVPAGLAGPAHMTVVPDAFPIDVWFLWPIALTDRLGAGALWGLILVGGAAAISVPWSFAAGKVKPARVIASRCQECNLCSRDCPYDAIAMTPRTDGRPGRVATIDVNKCVGCGICAGSCDSAAIGLEHFPVLDSRKQVDAWLDEGKGPVAFVCATSGTAAVDGRAPSLPGFRAMAVPCAGWVHPLSVERALKHGATEVLIITCGPGRCRFREGDAWSRQRLAGDREPRLRREQVDATRVRFLAADAPVTPRARGLALVSALLIAILVAASSAVPYASPASNAPTLVVSFVHPGEKLDGCRPLTAEEAAARPAHMRAAEVCERGRTPVRLQVAVDGEPLREGTYAPGGVWGDGASVALERIPVAPGEHLVRVAISDRNDRSWVYTDERRVRFVEHNLNVVVFDRRDGFVWSTPEAP